MEKTKVVESISSVGRFGTHITANPSGGYGFTGTVPTDLINTTGSFDECLDAFMNWFHALSNEGKRTHGPNLRNDVFALVWSGVTKL